MKMVIRIFFLPFRYLAINIILQRLDGYVPVLRYAKVVVLRFVKLSGPLAANPQIVLVEKPGDAVYIFCNLVDYLSVLAALIFLLFCTLIQFAVFSDMAIPARNVITIIVRIYAERIRVPDPVYVETYCLREFFLRVILLTIGNGDAMAFNIDDSQKQLYLQASCRLQWIRTWKRERCLL